VRVTVVGLVEANDPGEEYWVGSPSAFAVTSTTWPTYPFFTDEATFIETLAGYLPDMDSTYLTIGLINRDAINARNAQDIENRLHALDTAARQDIERTSLTTKLTDTIADYRQRLFFTRLPLLALMFQIVGIVLYYLVMIGTMLVERQAGEIALLKSRGAATWQIMAAYAIEGGVLALAGVLLGPPLAAGTIALLGPTPPFSDLSGGALLKVHLSGGAFALAAVGALMALAALLWPAYRATRTSIVHYKQRIGRPPQQPVFLRYYLDVFLIAVGALLFYELRQRGSLVTEQLTGDLSADPLLLVTPTLFMLMIALLFLRLFPLILRLAAWAARGLNGVAVPLGLRRVVRAPVHFSRLVLLLILVSAVGVFAAGFRPTLEGSYDDRSAYAAGSGLRLSGIRNPPGLPPDQLVQRVADASGAGGGTPAWRLSGSYNLGEFRSTDVRVLGVRPEEFARTAYWRGDFSGGSLDDLLKPLRDNRPPPPAGAEIPGDAQFIGVWAWTELPVGAVSFGLRIADEDGYTWDYPLAGPPRDNYQAGQWQFYLADLNRPNGARVADPRQPRPRGVRRLQLVYVRVNQMPQDPDRASVLFDDVQAAPSSTAIGAAWWETGLDGGTPVEGFESLDAYEVMNGQAATQVSSALSRFEGRAHEGRASAQLSFERRRGGQMFYGLRVRGDGAPLLVVASNTFLRAAKKSVGDTVQIYAGQEYVQAKIAGRFDYFPTFTPDADGPHLVVANLDRLLWQANRVGGRFDPGRVNEVWFKDAPAVPATADSLRQKGIDAEQIADLNVLRAAQQRDPLIAASWEGILFLSFVAVLLLTALGFTVYSYLSAQTRTLEFAILRTMGLSGGQILALVGFEQVFVILTGVIAGTVLGLPLARLMVGYMGITETGATVVPPFVSRVSWSAIAIADLALAALFVAAIAALVLLYARLAVHRALRMGEL
jgi:ABC-type lipoprotein release transport system permease subunit